MHFPLFWSTRKKSTMTNEIDGKRRKIKKTKEKKERKGTFLLV